VKTENKVLFIEDIIESVTQTQYLNQNNNGINNDQENGITTKKVIIDDVDLFFTKYVEATRSGLP
jgi:hypothetical protein